MPGSSGGRTSNRQSGVCAHPARSRLHASTMSRRCTASWHTGRRPCRACGRGTSAHTPANSSSCGQCPTARRGRRSRPEAHVQRRARCRSQAAAGSAAPSVSSQSTWDRRATGEGRRPDAVCARLALQPHSARPRHLGIARPREDANRVRKLRLGLVLEPAVVRRGVPHPRVALSTAENVR
eukprot:2000407-Prymnesium_polylepis.1